MPTYAKKLADVTTRLAKMSASDLLTTAGEKTRRATERSPLTKFQEYEVWQEVLDEFEAANPPQILTSNIKFTTTPGIREYVITEDMLAEPKEE